MASTLAGRDIYLSANSMVINNGIRYHDSTAKFNKQFFLYSLFDHKAKRDFKTNYYFILNNGNQNSKDGNNNSDDNNEYGNDEHIKQNY